MTEDRDFLFKFKTYMLKLLEQNHRTRIVHNINCDPISFSALLHFWIPMYMTGKLQSFFFPKYVDFTESNSLWMVKNKIALVGNCTLTNNRSRYSAIHLDPLTSSNYYQLFEEYLKGCRELIRIHDFPREMFEVMSRKFSKPGSAYLFAQGPFFASLPLDLLHKILQENDISGEIRDKSFKIHARWNAAIKSANTSITNKWIYNLDAIQTALSGDTVKYEVLSQMAGKEIYLATGDFKYHLKHVINLITNMPQIELALTATQPSLHLPAANFWFKSNTEIFVWPLEPFSCAVSSSEPTLLNGFESYCENLWFSIPRFHRDKSAVIAQLQNMIK